MPPFPLSSYDISVFSSVLRLNRVGSDFWGPVTRWPCVLKLWLHKIRISVRRLWIYVDWALAESCFIVHEFLIYFALYIQTFRKCGSFKYIYILVVLHPLAPTIFFFSLLSWSKKKEIKGRVWCAFWFLNLNQTKILLHNPQINAAVNCCYSVNYSVIFIGFCRKCLMQAELLQAETVASVEKSVPDVFYPLYPTKCPCQLFHDSFVMTLMTLVMTPSQILWVWDILTIVFLKCPLICEVRSIKRQTGGKTLTEYDIQ